MSLVGNVKWFNSIKGFGFITVITPDDEKVGTDIFVHFSNINVRDNNYKRLFPGEYVSFNFNSVSISTLYLSFCNRVSMTRSP